VVPQLNIQSYQGCSSVLQKFCEKNCLCIRVIVELIDTDLNLMSVRLRFQFLFHLL